MKKTKIPVLLKNLFDKRVLLFGGILILVITISTFLVINFNEKVSFYDYIDSTDKNFLFFKKGKDYSNLSYTKSATFGKYEGKIILKRNTIANNYSNEFVTKLSDSKISDDKLGKLVSDFVNYCTTYVGYYGDEIFVDYKYKNVEDLNKYETLKEKLLTEIVLFYTFVNNDNRYTINIYYENDSIYGNFSNEGEFIDETVKPSELTEEDINNSNKKVSEDKNSDGSYG